MFLKLSFKILFTTSLITLGESALYSSCLSCCGPVVYPIDALILEVSAISRQ